MTFWSRRAVLAAGSAAALTACSKTDSSRPPSSASPSPSTPAATTTSPTGTPWHQLARSLDGDLVRPDSPQYGGLRLTPNPRYDTARPLALAEVASAEDVATVLRFANDNGLPIALRSGGHSYPGWSAGDGRLVLDCRRLDGLTWSGTSATMGPGRHLADVYSGVAARARAIPGGSCPTVGLGGLTLGGGVGVLTRAFGLTCDHLTAAQVVTADGGILTASADEHPDLYWALRGGGGGHSGVTTSLTFDTVEAPTIVSTYLTWPATAAATVIPAWLDWIGAADARAWSTIKLLAGAAHPDGPSLGATITWVGPASGFDAMLAPILATGPSGRYDHTRGYLEAMEAYAGTGAREAFAATSHVAYEPPDASALTDLVDAIRATPGALQEAGVSIDALGGRVADLAPADTAFVHRGALATVQYTATYTSGSPNQAASYVGDLRSRMTPTWGDHAYVNYADATLPDPGSAYFGDNWSRLQQVRATYDPDGFFTQPQ
ncbi:FAD-binding oxidoreductase [Nocardioides humilatus]|uniref:FAD-binding oxidoreductase n=1 Tax=Nocardioides humilatus TaxID=2607660 RepID=A0A5B1LK32_9ACTN|nr:FAD-binding oxidoreductase [Nocardioides humilatus]KAA1420913.1 FAD-binding oxidoreductase [Nocardioides humilatus]